MGKGTGKLLELVGIAALTFFTLGVGTLVLGTGLGVGSALGITGAFGLTFATIGSIGLAAYSIGSQLSTSIADTGAADRSKPFVNPNALANFVFGDGTPVPLDLRYEDVTGNSPDRIVHDVYAHCWHPIDSFDSLTLGTDSGAATVTFSADAATGDFANLLWWYKADGTQSAALSGTHVSTNWPSTAIGAGMAHSMLVWNVDDGNFIAKFSGMPSSVTIVVHGALEYDPREDPAYGSGSQDFDDRTTWGSATGNAALVLLRFLLGEYSSGGKLIWGRGALETQIDMDSFVAMANVADELVDGIRRFRLVGFHQLDGGWDSFVSRWEEETGGKLRKSGGQYAVWLPNDDLTPLTTISDDDFLQGTQIQHSIASGIESFYNCARGQYIEPTAGYTGQPYAQVNEDDAITDDGGERLLAQDFSWIQDLSIAQRIARLKVRRSRFQRTWTFVLGWKGWHPNFRPYTVHTLNSAETADSDQLVRVIDRRLSFATGAALITVQQEDVSLYDETLPLNDPLASTTIPNRLDRNAVPGAARRIVVDSSTATSVTVTNQMHLPDGQSFNTLIVSQAYTPPTDGKVKASISCQMNYAFLGGGIAAEMQYSLQQDSAYDGFQEHEFYQVPPDPAVDTTYHQTIAYSRVFDVSAATATTIKFMAAKLQSGDTVAITNAELSLEFIPA